MKVDIEQVLVRISDGFGTDSDAKMLREEFSLLLSALADMCIQHGIWNEKGEVSSGGLDTDAEALKLLASHGRFDVFQETGRHVRGTFLSANSIVLKRHDERE